MIPHKFKELHHGIPDLETHGENSENQQQSYGPCVGNSSTLMDKHVFECSVFNKNKFYVAQELTKDLAILQ